MTERITYYHLSLVATLSNVIMKTNDANPLFITMVCKQFYETSLKLWLEVPTQSKNTTKYISIDQICEKFASLLRNALAAFHAFTRCHNTASIKRKRQVF